MSLRSAFGARNTILLSACTLSLLAFANSAQAKEEEARRPNAKPAAKTSSRRVQVAQAAPAPAAPPPAAAAPAPAPAAPAPAAPAPAAPAPAAPPADAAAPAPAAPPPDAAAPPADAAAPPPPADAAAAAEAEAPIEEAEEDVIRVTVDRRSKTIQEYAGSVSAFSQDELDKTGVNNVKSLSGSTPFVEIGQQENNVEIYVRGIGSSNNTELGDPATATHIDGVYIPRPRGVGAMMFDLERVELNRGPQGTLRGRNATAGSLNIITARPVLKEWDANASLQVGNFSQREARAMVNIPLGDKLALRLAAVGETHSPWYKNAGPINTIKASESADLVGYRASLNWQPVDALTVIVRHDYMQEGGTGSTGSNFNGALVAGLLPEEVPDPRAVVYRAPQGFLDSKHWGITGDITAALGPVSIQYLGSYRVLDFNQTNSGQAGIDYPGRIDYELDNASTTYWQQKSQSVIQELRLFSPDTARFRWTVGGFFFNEEQKTSFATTADKSNGFAGVEFTMPKMHSRSWAGFADGTFDILKTLRVTGGVRATTEEKERTGIGNVYSFGGITDQFRFGTDGFAYAGQGRTNYTAPPGAMQSAPFDIFRNGIARYGARDTISGALEGPGVTWTGSANEQKGSYSDKFVDFRLGVDGNISKSNLLYVMFSTGHKSGGFNDNVVINPPTGSPPGTMPTTVAPTYKPEAVYALEVGSKNEFANRKITANISAFWYHYVDLQIQSVQPIGEGVAGMAPPAAAVRSNAATSRVLGIEAEGVGHLPAGFLARLSALVLDARFTEGEVLDTRTGYGLGDQLPRDISGNFLPRAPQLSVNYALGQTIPSDIGYFDWVLSAQTKSKQYMTAFNGDGHDPDTGAVNPNLSDVVPSFSRLDIGVGYTHVSGKMRLDGFINNVTDAAHMTSIINTPNLNLRFFNPPRTMGVRISVFM